MKILTIDSERKVLYISAAINFFIGSLIGIILFYGQIRTDSGFIENGYKYDTLITLTDFLRLWWVNVMWLVSVLISVWMMPASFIHPVSVIRGCVNSFSLLYIFTIFGIKEAVATAIPQCFSALPLILIFSAELLLKRRRDIKKGNDLFSVKRRDIAFLLGISLLSSVVEIVLFRLFCSYLF